MGAHLFLLPLSLSQGGNTAGIHRRMLLAGVDGMHRHCTARADLKVTRLTCIPARTSRVPVSSPSGRISTVGIPRNFLCYKRARAARMLAAPTTKY